MHTTITARRGLSATERIITRTTRTDDGCLIYHGAISTSGYGQVRVVNHDAPTSDRNKRYRTVEAHRAIWTDAHGDVPDNTYVRHSCGNKLCMNADHLFLQPVAVPAA